MGSVSCRRQSGVDRSGSANDFLKRFLERGLSIYLVQFVSVFSGPNIKSIQRGAFFGGDPGMNGVEAMLIDGVEEIVEKSNTVDRLNLDHGEAGITLIVDVGSDRKGNGIIVVFPEKVVLCLKITAGKIVFLLVDFIEGHDHAHLPIVILYCLHIVSADPENIEGYSIFPGVDISGKDVDFVGGQGAADFFEEKMAVVSCNG